MNSRKIYLNKSDKSKISQIIKKGSAGRSVTRALVLKMKDYGYTNIEAAEIVEITPRTVVNICMHYLNGGLESALNDDPRVGRPTEINDGMKAQIIAIVCSNPPEGFDRWTLELLQNHVEENLEMNISDESIRLILHEHDLKPWRYKMWCVPKIDGEYVKRMNKILDLYSKPYSKEYPVVCIDEKPVILFGNKRESLAFSPGKPNRQDYEYSRNGSANVFCGVEPLVGKYFNEVTEYKKKEDFSEFIRGIYNEYKGADRIHLVLDNYATHFKSCVIKYFGEKEGDRIWSKFEVYYTPTHASWLNQAEIAIGMYTRQCLGNTRIDCIEVLKKKTKSWNRIANEKNVTIKWKFNKVDAKEKFNL